MQKVVVFGGTGLVGSNFIQKNNGFYTIIAPFKGEVNILDDSSVAYFLQKSGASCVVNFAAFTDVSEAEKEKGDKGGIVFRLNSLAVKHMAKICGQMGKHLIHISTEYVFDGKNNEGAYTEEDKPNPMSWYGATKYYAESFLRESCARHTIIRIAMPYAAKFELKKDIARKFLEMLTKGQVISAVSDSWITPIFVDDIAEAVRLIIQKRAGGVYHVVSVDRVSPFHFAGMIAQKFGLNSSSVRPVIYHDYVRNSQAIVLKNSSLNCEKFVKEFGKGILHSNRESLERFKSQCG